jgi:hypothetical protein
MQGWHCGLDLEPSLASREKQRYELLLGGCGAAVQVRGKMGRQLDLVGEKQ